MKNQIESIEKRGLKFLPVTDSAFHFVKMSVHYPNQNARENFEKEMDKKIFFFDFDGTLRIEETDEITK